MPTIKLNDDRIRTMSEEMAEIEKIKDRLDRIEEVLLFYSLLMNSHCHLTKRKEVEDERFEHTSIDFPKPIGTLTIHKGFTVFIYTKMPNRFHRWMAKVLLGWIYTDACAERNEDA